MADEEKKEGGEEAKEEKKESGDGGNKLLMIVIVVLLLLLLVIGGLVAYFLLSDNTENPDNPDEQKQEKQVEKKKDKPKRDSADLTVGPIYPLDKFIVNLMSDGARRYLKCTLNLEMDTPELQPELDQKTAPIRDIIIRILSSKTVAEISTSKGKEKLKEEIVRKINEILETGEIRHVYFVDFVIQ